MFDEAGTPLSFASATYPTAFPAPGWAEQEPGHWWAGLGTAVRQAVAGAGIQPSQVASICVDTTCCTVVALDAAGAALRPALLWMDMRSAGQAAKVAACGDEALAVNSAGAGPVSAEWMVPKVGWVVGWGGRRRRELCACVLLHVLLHHGDSHFLAPPRAGAVAQGE